MAALDALRAARARPTINLKFFFEGEEEAGSPHLSEAAQKYAELLRADAWLFCDGPVNQTRRMQVYFGARGVMGPTECGACDHEGHHAGEAPRLFAGLSKPIEAKREFDVPLSALMKDEN